MTIPQQYASLYDGQKVFVWSDYLLDLGLDFLVGNMVFVRGTVAPHFHGLYSLELCCEGRSMIHKHKKKMNVPRKRISRILELREILLSFQTGFNFVNAAVVCAILESI